MSRELSGDITLISSVRLDTLVDELVTNGLLQEELVEFVVALDAAEADLDFTVAVFLRLGQAIQAELSNDEFLYVMDQI